MTKMTPEQYATWKRGIQYRTNGVESGPALQRLGQAFLNDLAMAREPGDAPIHDPTLYFMEDPAKCEALIFERYIDLE